MNKYTIKQKVILEAFSMGYKEGTLMNVKVTLLDSDKNVLGIKADKTPTDKRGVISYKFRVETIAKELGINNICKVKYVKGWIDADGDGTVDYTEEYWAEVIFSIENIPNVMRNKLKWSKSAEIMDLWFSKKAKKMTKDEKLGQNGKTYDIYNKDYLNSTMFTMDWLLEFDRVKDGYKNLRGSIANDKARDRLKIKFTEHIKSLNMKVENRLIENNMDISTLHTKFQFQLEHIDYETGKLDDLYGSLGNFALYAAVSKYSIKNLGENKYWIEIYEVVIYMKDTFDFIGKQYLGHWNCEGMGIVAGGVGYDKSSEFISEKVNDVMKHFGSDYRVEGWEWKLPAWNPKQGKSFAIGNDDFNEYREKRKMGGDILLFSDVRKIVFHHGFPVEIRK